jgi:hypothetical protein
MGDIEAGPVIRFIVFAVLLALLAVTVALTISAVRENSRVDTLRHQGVPVQVTVTGCQGISSGVGMGIEYWQCQGTYSLDGRSYNEVIGGSRALLRAGQIVPAVAVPGQPRLLSATAAGTHSDWKPYLSPIILGGLLVLSVVTLLWWSKRRDGKDTRDTDAVEQTSNN